MRTPFGDDPSRGLDHRGDGGLVVGAEDRPGGVPDDAVLDLGLDAPLRRHGVEVGAEEDRRAPVGAAREPAEQVAGVGVDPGAGVVLLDLEAELAQLRGDAIGHGTLVPGRAFDRGELEKQL